MRDGKFTDVCIFNRKNIIAGTQTGSGPGIKAAAWKRLAA